MLDIKFIRENPEIVKKDLEKRQDKEKIEWIDALLEKDKEYRQVLKENEELRRTRNTAAEEINELKKEGKDISKKIKDVQEIPKIIKDNDEKLKTLKEEIEFFLMRIPNILESEVPFGKDSSENKIVKTHGEHKKFGFALKSHGELIEELGLADFKRATKTAGAGFYYLKGDLALLDIALQRFAIDFLRSKGFTLVEPPLMMNKDAYEGVTALAEFETVMYKIQDEDLYMIATSEHPMAAMFKDEVLEEKELPIKFCGVSPCFRREIGSHGVDTRGLFRVHQFNKVEQFIFCKPEDSKKFHKELQENSEEMYKLLGIPFRVVDICTGDIGIIATRKFDLEAWSPRENIYFEVGSNSNCTAYQATRLNIKYKKGDEKEYVNTLNNTAIATSRALRAIIENYQQEDGSIEVPKALQKYMDGMKFIKKQKVF